MRSVKPFEPKAAHSLRDEERTIVDSLFGSCVLPPDSLVSFDGKHLVIEHVNLDHFIDQGFNIDLRLVANGRLHFPIQ
jgi:hypothetical protein